MMHDEDRIMYNIYEEKEFLSLKMFSFIGHGYDLASFQCYLYNRDMFFQSLLLNWKNILGFGWAAYYEEWNPKVSIDLHMFIPKYLP